MLNYFYFTKNIDMYELVHAKIKAPPGSTNPLYRTRIGSLLQTLQ